MALFFTRAIQGILIPSEFVNRLKIFTWEQDVPERRHSTEYAMYSTTASAYSKSSDKSTRNNASDSKSRIPADEPELNAEDFEGQHEPATVLESDDIEEDSPALDREVDEGADLAEREPATVLESDNIEEQSFTPGRQFDGDMDLTGDNNGDGNGDSNADSNGDSNADSNATMFPGLLETQTLLVPMLRALCNLTPRILIDGCQTTECFFKCRTMSARFLLSGGSKNSRTFPRFATSMTSYYHIYCSRKSGRNAWLRL